MSVNKYFTYSSITTRFSINKYNSFSLAGNIACPSKFRLSSCYIFSYLFFLIHITQYVCLLSIIHNIYEWYPWYTLFLIYFSLFTYIVFLFFINRNFIADFRIYFLLTNWWNIRNIIPLCQQKSVTTINVRCSDHFSNQVRVKFDRIG